MKGTGVAGQDGSGGVPPYDRRRDGFSQSSALAATAGRVHVGSRLSSASLPGPSALVWCGRLSLVVADTALPLDRVRPTTIRDSMGVDAVPFGFDRVAAFAPRAAVSTSWRRMRSHSGQTSLPP